MIDDTAGHHARHTEWHWSAGVGEGPDGGVLAWNLVSGVNDPRQGSERAVWVAPAAGTAETCERRRPHGRRGAAGELRGGPVEHPL